MKRQQWGSAVGERGNEANREQGTGNREKDKGMGKGKNGERGKNNRMGE